MPCVWSGSWSCLQPPTFPSLNSLNEKQGPEKFLSPTPRGPQAMPTGWLLVVDSVLRYLGWVMVTHSQLKKLKQESCYKFEDS